MRVSDIEYDERFDGAKATALYSGASYVRSVPDTAYGSSVNYAATKGQSVTLTGYIALRGDVGYLQTVNGVWIYTKFYEDKSWEVVAGSKLTKRTVANAQGVVNKIIDCNKKIVSNNILCARFAGKLNQEQRKQLYGLQQRLEARNQSLLNDGLVSEISTNYPAGYAYLQSYLESFMASGGVGSVTVAIVVAAIVVASLSTAAYYAYKYYADEAERDVKYSEELTKVLTSKLTDAEYQQLLSETKGMLTKQKILSGLGSTGRWLAVAALAAGGVLLYKIWKR